MHDEDQNEKVGGDLYWSYAAQPADHWSRHPEFDEFLPVMEPHWTREEAETFKAVVLAECEHQAAYMRDQSHFAGQLKAADDAALYNVYRFLTSAKIAAESSAHWVPCMMVPWFAQELAEVAREASRRRLVMVLDDAALDPYAMGMILHLGYGPEQRQKAYEAAGIFTPPYGPHHG